MSRDIVLLPRSVGTLAKIAADSSEPRYVFQGVRLEKDEKTWRCIATNGKFLVLVEGQRGDEDLFPNPPIFAAADSKATAVSVPAKEWDKAFKEIPKRAVKPILENVAVATGENTTTFMSTNLENCNVSEPRNIDGRYPDYQQVLVDKKPERTFKCSIDGLVNLLNSAKAFAPDGMIEVRFFEGKDVVGVGCTTEAGLKFTGIVMSQAPVGLPVDECGEAK